MSNVSGADSAYMPGAAKETLLRRRLDAIAGKLLQAWRRREPSVLERSAGLPQLRR